MEVPSAATDRQAGTAERDALSNDNLPAAFWDALPTNEEHPDLQAIRALQEDSTPEERAETLKVILGTNVLGPSSQATCLEYADNYASSAIGPG